jgi:hypothetical protein
MTPAATLLLLALVPAADPLPANPSVADIEAAVLAERKSIRRGKLSLKANYTTPKGSRDHERTQTLWFDLERDRFRSDTATRNNGEDGGKPPPRHVQCLNCERPNYYVDYWEIRTADSVASVELKPLNAELRKMATEIFDPRLLGLWPGVYGLAHHHSLEEALGRPDREKPELRRERWKDLDCWVISYRDLRGTHIELWVAPSQGYSVVRCLAEGNASGKANRGVLETEYAPVGNSGLWYPRSWVYEGLFDGKPLDKEVGHVTELSFNEPLDDKVFTLAGMNIAPGTGIVGQEPNGQYKSLDWTGEAIIDHVNPHFSPTRQPAGTGWRGWLFGAAAGCSALAVLAIAFYWRRGGKPKAV